MDSIILKPIYLFAPPDNDWFIILKRVKIDKKYTKSFGLQYVTMFGGKVIFEFTWDSWNDRKYSDNNGMLEYDEKDVPEEVRKAVNDKISDPFFEIDLERFISENS
jgi:hypothetical protein